MRKEERKMNKLSISEVRKRGGMSTRKDYGQRYSLLIAHCSLLIALLFSACILGGDVEAWRGKAQEANGPFTVTFYANGGTPAPDPQTIAKGGRVTEPQAMTKTGFGFGGWYREEDLSSRWNFNTDTVTGNIILYAGWDINYYTVTFNANGGTPAPATQSVAHGGTVAVPAPMTKTGVGFGGWYREAALINQWNFDTDVVTGDTTLYVKWDTNYYTVSFNAGGGTPAPSPQNIAHGGTVIEPDPMTQRGYIFDAWYREPSFTTKWNFAANTVTGNITLYAGWIVGYTVTFSANGGSGTPPPAQAVRAGESITIPDGSGLSRIGNTFDGWNTNQSGMETTYRSGETFTPTANITLYAKWNINYHTVSFNAGGGTPAPETQNIAYGGRVTEPPAMTRIGYAFDGWYTEPSFTNKWNFAANTVTGNITLYAGWITAYTVTFNANGGTPEPTPQYIASGGRVTEPSAMTRSEYIFDAWYKEASFSNKWNFATDTVTANTILYAKWDENLLESVTGLANKLAWLQTNAQSNGAYILGVDADEFIGPRTFDYFDHNGTEAYPFPLTDAIWTRGSISTSGSAVWYSFTVVSGTTYYVWLNDSQAGQDKTLTARVSAYYGSGSSIFTDAYSMWSSPRSFTAPSNGTVKIRVTPYSSNYTGTFAVAYRSGSNTRPNTSSETDPATGRKSNVTVTLRGIGSNRTVYLSSNGSLFTVGSGVTLVLDANITLQGRIANTASLVTVNSGGSLRMNAGSAVTGNTLSTSNSSSEDIYSRGGGVYVNGGTFTMNGGTVSGNTATTYSNCHGGGVATAGNGTFNKTGGTVYGYSADDTTNSNTVKGNSGTVQSNRGHAVYASANSVTKRMENTAGEGVNLWWNGNNNSPVFSGEWEY